MGVRAERWACVMHVSCAVSPCVDCGRRTVVQLCRLWVHALAVFNIYINLTFSSRRPHSMLWDREMPVARCFAVGLC